MLLRVAARVLRLSGVLFTDVTKFRITCIFYHTLTCIEIYVVDNRSAVQLRSVSGNRATFECG